MNASQLIAWFICLGLALFGGVLAVRNSYKLEGLERRFVAVTDTTTAQSDLLDDIHSVLLDINRKMDSASAE